jgi:hypothetical protein
MQKPDSDLFPDDDPDENKFPLLETIEIWSQRAVDCSSEVKNELSELRYQMKNQQKLSDS